MSSAPITMELPPLKYLQECFVYNPATGKLRWKMRPREHFKTRTRWAGWNTQFAGKIAGCIHHRGVRIVRLNWRDIRSYYMAHRIIFKLKTGSEPPETIDHIDGNGLNNRRKNLRPATTTEQQWNSGRQKNNSSGRRGVSPQDRKWRARIMIHGVRHCLGTFDTTGAASKAYERAARQFQGEFYRRMQSE